MSAPTATSSTPPRTLLVSVRGLAPSVSSASAYEFEDTIAAIDRARVGTVERIAPRRSGLESRITAHLHWLAGITFRREGWYSKCVVDRDYDLLFMRVMAPGDLGLLHRFPGWKRCKRRICWIEEVWVDWLKYESMLKPLEHFDHVFLGHAATCAPLSRLIGRPCTHLAPGVDALRFCPYPDPPVRTIDVYGMGRRSADTHRHLLEHAREDPHFFYLYDSARLTTFTEGHQQHRELMASLVKRTRYFIVNRAKADAPEQTGGQEEFGPRYFEGAAAGAILLGDAPSTGPFRDYFDWPDALFELPYGSTGFIPLMRELDAEPERVERARRAGAVNALRRHDWLYRWAEVLRAARMPETEAMRVRRNQLATLADRIDQIEA